MHSKNNKRLERDNKDDTNSVFLHLVLNVHLLVLLLPTFPLPSFFISFPSSPFISFPTLSVPCPQKYGTLCEDTNLFTYSSPELLTSKNASSRFHAHDRKQNVSWRITCPSMLRVSLVIMAWRVLGLRMEETRVDANILNRQSIRVSLKL